MLKPGDKAPDFNLIDSKGDVFQLSEKIKDGLIVLFFYPKNETRGCIAEACSFRDQYEVFKDQGAAVVGISSDDLQSHQKFSSKYSLPYVLLSDTGGKVRKLYDVPRTLGLIPGRTTYVIDQAGIIRYAFNSLTKPLEHVAGALEILKALQGSGKVTN